MKKIYVIDTNVILNSADAILKFEEHWVAIPQPVLSELDDKKREIGEIGYNSREFSRIVDDLRTKGNLVKGVSLNDKGGLFFVELYSEDIAKEILPSQDMSIVDNQIISCALSIKQKHTDKEVILVSKDTNVRIISDIFGIKSEDYKNSQVKSDSVYTGIQHIEVEQILIDKIYEQKELTLADIFILENEPFPNECFVFHSLENTKQSALARYDSVMKLFKLLPQDMKTCDLLPKNTEQQFALDLLKDPNVPLVSLEGLAGSGKTILALASAIYGVLETQRYDKILLLKPIVPMDNSHELGFMPGTMMEKLAPWMASYMDAIAVIMQKYIKTDDVPKKRRSKREEAMEAEKSQGKLNPMEELISLGLLEVGSLENIRGRSLPNQFIIIDECQGLTRHAIRTIVTRVGEGTKIVLLGDPSQIDSPYLDSKSNGLVIVIDAFKNEEVAGHISMKHSVRSRLAEIATKIL